MTSAPTPTSAATVTGRGQPLALPPLQWWQTADPILAGTAAAAVLRQTLAGIAMLGEPGWHAAVRGDAAMAVRIALQTNRGRPSPLTINLVCSALLLCAIEGNAAAQVTLQYLRRRFGSSTAVNQDKTAAGGVEVA
jgi:hypothetical protein